MGCKESWQYLEEGGEHCPAASADPNEAGHTYKSVHPNNRNHQQRQTKAKKGRISTRARNRAGLARSWTHLLVSPEPQYNTQQKRMNRRKGFAETRSTRNRMKYMQGCDACWHKPTRRNQQAVRPRHRQGRTEQGRAGSAGQGRAGQSRAKKS